MMEMIRSWRTLSFGGFGRAALERIRAWRILHFTKWTIAVLLIGMLTGAMAVVLPPLASIGVVAMLGVLLLWAMPDLHFVPEKLLRRIFFVMVGVQLCVPAYYAIDIGYLPWISARRFFSLSVILLFSLVIAGSASAREKVKETLRDSRSLTFCVLGFLLTIFLSILGAKSVTQSMASFVDSLLNWYIPFFVCILIVRTADEIILVAKIIVVSALIVGIAGIVEFFLQHRYFFDIFPRGILAEMMARNPALAVMVNVSMFRNGLYRAASIFSVSLSFSEFLTMAAPIAGYFVLHGSSWRQRVIGAVTILVTIAGLMASGSRGGYLCFLISMPLMMLLWTARYTRFNPSSMVGAIMFSIFSAGMIAVMVIIFSSGRLSNMVFGGGDTASSTQARFIQWNAALPHIISNPVTGHGVGSAGDLIGFAAETGVPSVDSYIITLLVDQGAPSLFLFFGMLAIGIWIAARIYLTDASKHAELAGAIACSLVAFSVYRVALSQRENHTLLFLMIGMVFATEKLVSDRRKKNKHGGGHNLQNTKSRPAFTPPRERITNQRHSAAFPER